jgi:hypothetical protein
MKKKKPGARHSGENPDCNFARNTKSTNPKRKQTAFLLAQKKILDGRCLAANNVVALDDRRHSD